MFSMEENFGEVIYAYTRAQAINDGVLVDVSSTAKEAGFRYPVAVTQRVWAELVTPAEVLRQNCGQSEDGRLWDVLWMLYCTIKGILPAVKHYRDGVNNIIHFQLYALMMVWRQKPVECKVSEYKRQEQEEQLITLKAVCSPGDQGEPVLTIMYPDED